MFYMIGDGYIYLHVETLIREPFDEEFCAIDLEKEQNYGDTIYNNGVRYIIVSDYNSKISEANGIMKSVPLDLRCGTNIVVFPEVLIREMSSDVKLNIAGFDCVKEVTDFYGIKSISKNLDFGLDYNDKSTRITYTYSRNVQ